MPVLVGLQFAGLLQHGFTHTYLADVVEFGTECYQPDVFLAHAQVLGDGARVDGNP